MVKKTASQQSREWRKKNPEKVKAYAKKYGETHKEEIRARSKIIRNEIYFDGKCDEIFERDNWQCQECGVSPEQSIILFNRRLAIHHIDENKENNDPDNLITLCIRCHCRLHGQLRLKKKWGDLLEQDDSEYRFPKIRELVDKEAKKLGGIQKAKRKIAEELDVSFWTIDTKYYERKISPKP